MVAHHPTCKCPDCELDDPSRYGGGAVCCSACGRLFVHADDCPRAPGGVGPFFGALEETHPLACERERAKARVARRRAERRASA